MGIKGWVNPDGKGEKETGLISSKETDVLNILLALKDTKDSFSSLVGLKLVCGV